MTLICHWQTVLDLSFGLFVGKNNDKKEKIIEYLKNKGYQLIDVAKELDYLYKELNEDSEPSHDIGQ